MINPQLVEKKKENTYLKWEMDGRLEPVSMFLPKDSD